MKYGFVKVAAAIPAVKVADCKFNAQQIDTQIAIADGKGVQIIVFPELCITGYTCADLFGQTLLLEEAEIALMQIMNNRNDIHLSGIVHDLHQCYFGFFQQECLTEEVSTSIAGDA